MRKRLLILAIVVLATHGATAGAESNAEFGLKVGAYWSVGSRGGHQSSYLSPVRFAASPCGGITVTQKFSNVLALQFEALYFNKKIGLTHDNDLARVGLAVDQYRFQVVEFPLLFKVTPRFGSEKFKGSIYTGPYLGFIYSAKVNYNGYYNRDYNGERDVSNINKGFDWGMAGGIEVGRVVGNGELFVDARFDLGLLNIRPGQVYGNPHSMWVENIRGMVVTMGYRFRM